MVSWTEVLHRRIHRDNTTKKQYSLTEKYRDEASRLRQKQNAEIKT